MIAKSIKGKSPEEIKNAILQVRDNGFNPTLAIVFLSINIDYEEVSNVLNSQGIQIFGSTAAGEFVDGELEKEAASILLLDMNKDYFRVHLENRNGKSRLKTAAEIGRVGMESFSRPAFIIAAGGSVIDGEAIIEGIDSAAGKETTIFGGIAGDDLRGTETRLFTNYKSSNDGIIALIVNSEQVQLTGLATHGWKPVGTVRTITDSEDYKVYSIDDKPALDIMTKFLGMSLEDYPEDDVVHNVGKMDPIQLIREKECTVTRAIRYVSKKDKSILLAGPVARGTKIRFSLPPDNDIIDKVTAESRYIKEHIQPESDAMIMFSCISRYYSLGPMVSTEIEEVQKVWNSPMTGLFCFGEIGKSLNGSQEFHNNTCCFVVMKEK